MSVLIIDDEESIRISLKYHFEDCGFRTRSVDSAEEALSVMDEELPDAVIVDLRLPGMDGLEFLRIAISRWPDVHYIIYTGSPAASVPEDLVSIPGVSGRLFFKPLVDLAELSDHVTSLVKGG
ncbi:MAG: response regulator [Candidatus Fermentibacteraceae bacterium]|nr:response regulator [Candidatus Fermentibacteraceae bacterium]MBN2608113.1 response regulator [Candidatus Fermentibacteraceae bacterium]